MIGRSFMTAGRAVFTVSNPNGQRYTYRVTKKEDEGQDPIFFVSLLTGPDNTRDYTYLGVLEPNNGHVRLTRKSKYSDESIPVRVVRWVTHLVWGNKNLPEHYDLHHEGRCGRCGAPLTVPESIETGLGPICAKKSQ